MDNTSEIVQWRIVKEEDNFDSSLKIIVAEKKSPRAYQDNICAFEWWHLSRMVSTEFYATFGLVSTLKNTFSNAYYIFFEFEKYIRDF